MLWSLVFLRLLLPYSLETPLSIQPFAFAAINFVWTPIDRLLFPPALTPEVTTARVVVESEEEPVELKSEPAPAAVSASSFELHWEVFILFGIPLIGMLVLSCWMVVTTVRLRRWVQAGTECDRAEWLALLDEGRREFGIRFPIGLRIIPALNGPATSGWWQPVILLPEDSANWSISEMRHVLWHELAHVVRRDVATNWLLSLMSLAHWWNPMFQWAKRTWLSERELACDAMALRHLQGDDVREYGRTLLRFVERLSANGSGLPASAPGFVYFWGGKRTIRRRLQELPRLAKPEKRWRRWVTAGVVLVTAVSLLTDHVRSEPKQINDPKLVQAAPIELPDGTTWELSSPNGFFNPKGLVTRNYTVADLVDNLRQHDPKLTTETALIKINKFVEEVVKNQAEGDTATVREYLATQSLIIRAQPWQHEEVTQFLNCCRATKDVAEWKNRSHYLTVASVMMSTKLSLKEILPDKGGVVLNTDHVHPGLESGTSIRGERIHVYGRMDEAPWTVDSVPTYMRIMTEHAGQKLVARLLQDKKNKVEFTPKVSVIEGLTALFGSTVDHPFVTGMNQQDGKLTPQVSIVPEGVQLKIRPKLEKDGQALSVFVEYQHAEVTSVEVLESITDGKPVMVQHPKLTRSLASTRVTIPPDHVLLLAPLRRDSQGRMNFCLITRNWDRLLFRPE
jgi:beta-lactamase regulating signal transducer with metallopeptidase domain